MGCIIRVKYIMLKVLYSYGIGINVCLEDTVTPSVQVGAGQVWEGKGSTEYTNYHSKFN